MKCRINFRLENFIQSTCSKKYEVLLKQDFFKHQLMLFQDFKWPSLRSYINNIKSKIKRQQGKKYKIREMQFEIEKTKLNKVFLYVLF